MSILRSHILEDKISHSYLFVGREGFGKEYLAKEFAKYILCQNREKKDCKSCLMFSEGVHPDFFHIDGREGIKIGQVRLAIEKINLTPVFSKKKVLLISRAENIGIEAANALLKTLEEPPGDSVVLITVKSEKKLPKTVISRSQILRLSPVSENDLRSILKELDYPAEKIEDVLSVANGNIGESKSFLENVENYKIRKKTINDAKKLFLGKSLIANLSVLEEYDKEKRLDDLFDVFSTIFFINLRAGAKKNLKNSLWHLDKNLSTERTKSIGRKILKAYRDLDYNISLRIALEEIILEEKIYE